MSCIVRIKENIDNLTVNEKKIGMYILDNQDIVIKLSVQELAQKIGVSAASIIRFSKAIGYSGYSSMKIEIAKRLDDDDYDHGMIVDKCDEPQSILNRLEQLNISIIEKGKNLIEETTLKETIKIIGQARKIYLYGVGASGIVAYDLFTKFSRVNIECSYNTDTHIQAISSAYVTKDDVVIAISYSGMTNEVRIPVEIAKEKGAKIISITSNKKSKIGKLADINFLIPREETAKRVGAITSRNSQLFITDILYLGVISNYVEDIEGSITGTKEIINMFY
ncbi:MAG: MurR/RpiR family transcriptional regulator [Sarcina sp.]